MSTLSPYNGVQIVTPEPLAGAGGQALNDNFKYLADNKAELDADGAVPFYRRSILPSPSSSVTATVTIPAIAANSRQVVTVQLGSSALKNPHRATIAFFASGTNTTDISNLKIDSTGYATGSIRLCGNELGIENLNLLLLGSPRTSSRVMVVTTDYRNATRGAGIYGVNERYGASATQVPAGFTYTAMGVGVIFGYYNTASTGVFNLNQKVEMESAWLDTPGAGNPSTLSIALYNRGSGSNSSLSLIVAVYE